MNFASDNIVGASAPVMQALMRANAGAMPAYGNDPLTAAVKAKFATIFEHDVAVFLVTTGTAANALALSAAVPPWGLCVCHEEAHVIDDECGAPEFFMHGAKLKGLPGMGGKIEPGILAAYLESLPKAVKQMPPKALSISQVTECGMVYSCEEIAALGAVCRERGLFFHMDGARFANALVSLGCTPAEMTWKQGVDILSFGATKNGCLMAEAIVVFNPVLAEAMDYRAKRAGQIISKGRLIAAQLEGYFADDHWLSNARHANAMAKRLSEGLLCARTRACLFDQARSHPVSSVTTHRCKPPWPAVPRERVTVRPEGDDSGPCSPRPRSEAVGFGDLPGGGGRLGRAPVAEDEDEEQGVRVEDELGLHGQHLAPEQPSDLGGEHGADHLHEPGAQLAHELGLTSLDEGALDRGQHPLQGAEDVLVCDERARPRGPPSVPLVCHAHDRVGDGGAKARLLEAGSDASVCVRSAGADRSPGDGS